MNTSFQTASEQSPGRFGNAQRLLGHLDANVISNLITTTADVVLVMDDGDGPTGKSFVAVGNGDANTGRGGAGTAGQSI